MISAVVIRSVPRRSRAASAKKEKQGRKKYKEQSGDTKAHGVKNPRAIQKGGVSGNRSKSW